MKREREVASMNLAWYLSKENDESKTICWWVFLSGMYIGKTGKKISRIWVSK